MITIRITLEALKPGGTICRESAGIIRRETVRLPLAECQEVRPDWGEYSPVTTFPAIERALKCRGHLYLVGSDRRWWFGIEKDTP